MFGFEEEEELFILEFPQVPWLIWLNLLVIFIFILLLYYFVFYVANTGAEADEIMSIDYRSGNYNKYRMQKLESCSQDSKLWQMSKDQTTIEGIATTSTRSRRRNNQREAEVIQEMAEFQTQEVTQTILPSYSWGPCYWLELGRKAFLRCLGLDSKDSSTTQPRNEPHGDVPGKSGRPTRPPMNSEGNRQT